MQRFAAGYLIEAITRLRWNATGVARSRVRRKVANSPRETRFGLAHVMIGAPGKRDRLQETCSFRVPINGRIVDERASAELERLRTVPGAWWSALRTRAAGTPCARIVVGHGHGKGVRAITRAAFNLALLRLCIEDERPFPNFVLIDSRLLVYEEPDADESSFPQDIKKHFWASVKTSFTEAQVINHREQPPTTWRWDARWREGRAVYRERPRAARLHPARSGCCMNGRGRRRFSPRWGS
jgi:hypothetical protein